ncbi:MAG TPA: alpha/beta hydrolase [Clostridia bacterium]|nr:alpha/beta hydrolase [Clostridia bacterium]HPQ48182.1 alpha/beta hydrolase [Clostridia bacterium]
MIYKKIIMDSERNTSLACYILDGSSEFPNISKRPAVLIFPGGGYRMCSDREAEPVAMAFLNEGYHAFVLRYTVGPESVWPVPLIDAEKALEYIKDKSDEWMVDGDRIAVAGFSAGGHLAAAISTLGRIRPDAAILGYPCILEERCSKLCTPKPGLDYKVTPLNPPTFMFTTSDDVVVPAGNTVAFLKALGEAGVPYEAHIFQTGAHGISLAKSHTSAGKQEYEDQRISKWFELCIGWLKEVFGA